MTRPPHQCRCGVRWGGANTSHCSGCHRTFSGLTAFDLHRKGGGCLSPDEVGLVRNRHGYYGQPAPEDANVDYWTG